MKRFSIPTLFAILPAVMLGLLLTGCGKKTEDDELPPKTGKTKTDGKGGPATASLKPVESKDYSGVIRGMVTWTGTEPNLQALTDTLKSGINKDKDYCLLGKRPDGSQSNIQPYETSQQSYRIGENKGLGYVFVWIVPEKGHYFAIPDDQLKKFENTEVRISQPHCAFEPHAEVLFPSYYKDGKQVPSGQKFVVENDAVVSHNSKVQGGLSNQAIDRTLAPKTHEIYAIKPDNSPITVSCGIHSWMKGYLRAFDHPYAAVTSVGGDVKAKKYEDPKSPNYGKYEITGVPVGAKVRIIAWHEDLGFLEGDAGKELEIKKDTEVNFTAKAK
jgi:hypothetical protein